VFFDSATNKSKVVMASIQALAGAWVKVDEEGRPTDEVVSTYRPTAGGHAVLEMLFEGTDMEMVTVYHTDGDALVLTHYCVAGNAPSMQARADSPEGTIRFECRGGANLEDHDRSHMHAADLRFLVEAHGLERVVLIAHEGCGFYAANTDLPADEVLAAQRADLAKAAAAVRELTGVAGVDGWMSSEPRSVEAPRPTRRGDRGNQSPWWWGVLVDRPPSRIRGSSILSSAGSPSTAR